MFHKVWRDILHREKKKKNKELWEIDNDHHHNDNDYGTDYDSDDVDDEDDDDDSDYSDDCLGLVCSRLDQVYSFQGTIIDYFYAQEI